MVCERSWRLRCSLLLKALAQNWHLYFLSGCVAPDAFRGVDAAGAGVVVAGAVVGATATLAPGILDVVVVGSGDDEAASLLLLSRGWLGLLQRDRNVDKSDN